MTRIEPIYFAALAVAIAAAIGLQFMDFPHPWPAVIALNVYGLIAWPGISQEVQVTQRTYAGGWMAAGLILVLLEKLAPMAK